MPDLTIETDPSSYGGFAFTAGTVMTKTQHKTPKAQMRGCEGLSEAACLQGCFCHSGPSHCRKSSLYVPKKKKTLGLTARSERFPEPTKAMAKPSRGQPVVHAGTTSGLESMTSVYASTGKSCNALHLRFATCGQRIIVCMMCVFDNERARREREREERERERARAMWKQARR